MNEQGNEAEREMASNAFVVGFRSAFVRLARAVKFQLSRLTVTMSWRVIEGLKRHSKFDPGSR